MGLDGARERDAHFVRRVDPLIPAAAIALHEAAGEDAGRLRAARAHPSRRRLVDVAARVREARWLRERARISAAIDISDGVSGDVRHVAERSGARIVLEAESIPVHPAAGSAAGELAEDPLRWALDGGEEWELLLTAPEGELEPLAVPFAGEFGVELTPIGEVAEGAGVGLARPTVALLRPDRAYAGELALPEQVRAVAAAADTILLFGPALLLKDLHPNALLMAPGQDPRTLRAAAKCAFRAADRAGRGS